MSVMTPEQFIQYAQQGFNRIPISREVLADLDTPLSAYIKLADGDRKSTRLNSSH